MRNHLVCRQVRTTLTRLRRRRDRLKQRLKKGGVLVLNLVHPRRKAVGVSRQETVAMSTLVAALVLYKSLYLFVK
jgi:hypothetical protein